MGNESTLVYSTEHGKVIGASKRNCNKGMLQKPVAAPPSDGVVRLRRETKGRGGGTVVVITGVPLQGAALKELAGSLKKKCGCGGTIKDGIIEIQGDHRDLLMQELQAKGYRVKLAGG